MRPDVPAMARVADYEPATADAKFSQDAFNRAFSRWCRRRGLNEYGDHPLTHGQRGNIERRIKAQKARSAKLRKSK